MGALEPCRLYLQMCHGQSALARVLVARGRPEEAEEPDAAAGRCLSALAGLASCEDFMRQLLLQEQAQQGAFHAERSAMNL